MKRQITGGNEEPTSGRNRRLHRHIKALLVFFVGCGCSKTWAATRQIPTLMPEELTDL